MSGRHAICFGLNYHKTPRVRLRGCINDVKNIEKLLKTKEYNFTDVRVFTDDVPNPHTTYDKIQEELELLAARSIDLDLETVWIHFAGHGTQSVDENGDEIDRKDECIVPSDHDKGRLLKDDDIKKILRKFNPNTKIICVFDCCHSGTLGDLKYRYTNSNTNPRIESNEPACESKIIFISGCMDNQTSADAYNVRGQRQFSGAMTSCLLLTLDEAQKQNKMNVFYILSTLKEHLRKRRYRQIPQLTTSYIIDDGEILINV